jgi:hypothetical protein
MRSLGSPGGGREHADAVFILSTLIEKARAGRKDLYVAFIDFSKAYDSVDHASMQAKLLLEGICGRVYTVLQSMYEHVRSVNCIPRRLHI